MSNEIDQIRGYQPDGGGGLYLKLSDGDEVKVRIFSLPAIFENEYKVGEEVSLSARFGFIVWNHEINKAQVWVTNAATYGQQISPLLEDDEYGDWREYDVKLKRTGEKAQTRYHIRPGVKRYDLSDEQLASCGNLDLLTLLKKSPSASKVMWLSEYRELEEEAKQAKEDSGLSKARAEATRIKNKAEKKVPEEEEDEVVEDIGDEPINLSDIPF